MQIKLPFSIPINYKTIILGVMVVLIFILLIAALIVSKNKSITIPIIKKPETIEPTPTTVKKLPSEIQIKIDSINEKIDAQPEIEAPIIDPKIGL